jgi:DNA-binding CsgD family transcriptional regulator
VLEVQAATSLNAEQEEMARQAFTCIQATCSLLELGILAMKIADIPDTSIAQHYGMSRPTIIKHKKNIMAKVEAELLGLDEAVQRRAIEMLADRPQEGGDDV